MSLSNVCMLCLQSSEVLIEIFSRRGIEFNLESILKEHFWFEVDEYEEKSICGKCWQTVYDFHLLYTSVQAKHQQCDKFKIVESNDYEELPVLLDAVKDEPNIDINNELGNTVKDEPNVDIKNEFDCLPPDIPDISWSFDAIESTDNSPTVTQVNRKHNSPSKTKVYKSDYHTTLLSTYFNMSCDLCNAPLPTYREAKKHFRINHNVEKGYLICCSKKFINLPAMLQHCQWHLNPDSFKCDHCSKTFIDRRRLRKHINACHASRSGKVFQCNDCDKVFSTQQCLDAHVKNISHTSGFHEEHEMIRNRFSMQCDLCGQPFVIFRDVKMHHATAHNQVGYLNCCNKKFFEMSRAVEHCLWHADPKSLKCTICQICFVDKVGLRQHIRKVHSPEAESFPKKSTFLSYMKEIHSKDEERVKAKKQDIQFECHICRQGFLILPLLKRHINKVHRSTPSHICELCSKSFASRQSYQQHYINFHTKILRKVQCEQCGKWMKHEMSLKKHMRLHNSKSATCGICKQVYPNVSALRGHILHTHREASLQCTVCGKRVKRQSALKEHMAIHTGVTDLYTCTFCTKTFRSNANMHHHRKRAHPEELKEMKASLNCVTTPPITM